MGITIVGNISLLVIYNGILGIIYYMEHPFFEQYKIQKTKRWPWV